MAKNSDGNMVNEYAAKKIAEAVMFIISDGKFMWHNNVEKFMTAYFHRGETHFNRRVFDSPRDFPEGSFIFSAFRPQDPPTSEINVKMRSDVGNRYASMYFDDKSSVDELRAAAIEQIRDNSLFADVFGEFALADYEKNELEDAIAEAPPSSKPSNRRM